MDMSQDGFLGEGTSCVCWKGRDVESGREVAIKVYKRPKVSFSAEDTCLTQFRRSIAVLQQLQRPFEKPADPKLWTPELANVKPASMFLCLLDYSRNADNEAGYDSIDGKLYVVTELGQYSLKDYIATRRQESSQPSKDTVRIIGRAIIMVMAGLHAKGLVHMDLKPENLMFFDGCLKLIDVDSCVEIGTCISVNDSSISFSPCYCAPEWAGFLIQKDNETCISATPGLDAWSVGCTICELVTLRSILKPAYVQFTKMDRQNAMLFFMNWLTGLEEAPVPRALQQFDFELDQIITRCFLVCEKSERRTCAESLGAPCLQPDKLQRTKSCPLKAQEAGA